MNVSSDSAESPPYFGFKCFSTAYDNKVDIHISKIGYLPVVPHSPSAQQLWKKSLRLPRKFQRTRIELYRCHMRPGYI